MTQGSCTQIAWTTTCTAGARGCGGRVNVGGRIIFGGGRNGLVWSIWREGRSWGRLVQVSHSGTEAQRHGDTEGNRGYMDVADAADRYSRGGRPSTRGGWCPGRGENKTPRAQRAPRGTTRTQGRAIPRKTRMTRKGEKANCGAASKQSNGCECGHARAAGTQAVSAAQLCGWICSRCGQRNGSAAANVGNELVRHGVTIW